jgi:F-type H+-transporting ATPase subunit b
MFVTPGYAQETTAPALDEAHTVEDAAHGGGAFPPFDPSTFPSQLLWLAITFGLFYLFLKRVVLPRVGGILEVRRDRIAQDLDQAARMKSEADAAVAAYEQELAEARQGHLL